MPSYTAHESIAVAGAAIGLTAATIANMGDALLTVEDAAIRFTVDGTTPTATVGHLAQPGDVIKLTSPDELQKFRAIRQGGVSGTLKATYGTGGS